MDYCLYHSLPDKAFYSNDTEQKVLHKKYISAYLLILADNNISLWYVLYYIVHLKTQKFVRVHGFGNNIYESCNIGNIFLFVKLFIERCS